LFGFYGVPTSCRFVNESCHAAKVVICFRIKKV
jgi:hypothetical protein